jgi:hypothetical protein
MPSPSVGAGEFGPDRHAPRPAQPERHINHQHAIVAGIVVDDQVTEGVGMAPGSVPRIEPVAMTSSGSQMPGFAITALTDSDNGGRGARVDRLLPLPQSACPPRSVRRRRTPGAGFRSDHRSGSARAWIPHGYSNTHQFVIVLPQDLDAPAINTQYFDENDHEIKVNEQEMTYLTRPFTLSGWRDLNSRPLDPQIGLQRLSSVNHCSLASTVDR